MTEPNEIDRIAPIRIEDEMSSSYIDYSMSVIAGRALPDARDGLKPVHRRVLFAMRDLGNTHNRAYKKSARVVGDVIGKYHPHGDTAVYETMVRMAQDWSMRGPLVDGQGNFGSRDGDSAAAMRYTEVRMERLAEELLADIDKDTVDFGPNYDESLEQPLVLPSKFPNLLLNGSTGIAVGMATNIPPHNLGELVDGLLAYIDNPDITITELLQYIQGPDFPTRGVVCGKAPVISMYRTGRGQIRLRGRVTVTEHDNGKSTIIINELPFNVNKAKLIENIALLVQNKVIEGITALRDESGRKEEVRIVIETKSGVFPDIIVNHLYKHTQLQNTFGAIMLALVNGQPRVLNLRELLKCFTDHRFEVVTRRTQFELLKAKARGHILEGLRIAQDNMDEVVRIIRQANNRETAHLELRAKFGLSDAQSKAILDMRLYQITGLERDKLEAEYTAIMERIGYLQSLLDDPAKIYGIIKDELAEIKERYADARRTEITAAADDVNIEDLIADETCLITISQTGYVKRLPPDTFKEQRRGGKGVAGMATKDEDYVEHLFSAETHDSLMFFTSLGRVYIEKVYQIPEASRTSRGKAIVNLLNLREGENIAAMIRVRGDLDEQRYVVMATEHGVVKRSNLGRYRNVRKDGIIAINLDDTDELIEVKLTDGSSELILATADGMSCRFDEGQLRDQGRNTRGVRGIKLRDSDIVKSLEVITDDVDYLICTENGYGKRTDFGEFRLQKRGGYGIIAIRTSDRNGKLVSARAVTDSNALMLITANGKMIRMGMDTVSVIGRATQGVRLINLDDGDQLVAATTFDIDESSVTEDDDDDSPVTDGDAQAPATADAEATDATPAEDEPEA